MKKEKVKKSKRIFIIVFIMLLMFSGIVLIVISITKKPNKAKAEKSTIINNIEGYKGYARVVGREEYDFYFGIVKRNLENLSGEALEIKVKEEINRINATFHIGNKLGISEPYSFDSLKRNMENENLDRQIKKEKGEAIYGVEEFTLNSYYQYVISNLEIDIATYIAETAAEDIVDDAKIYFQDNVDEFAEIESITLELVASGETVTEIYDSNGLKGIQNSDGQLFDFLLDGAEGEDFSYNLYDEERKVIIIKKTYIHLNFEENQSLIIRKYVSNILYNDLVNKVAENNQVEFNKD